MMFTTEREAGAAEPTVRVLSALHSEKPRSQSIVYYLLEVSIAIYGSLPRA
jgi:hypothetical protein